MLKNLLNVFKIAELKNKVLFTAFILVLYRLGGYIPVPGIDTTALGEFFATSGGEGTLFGMFDMFVGGNFQRASIFALGIMPYITASIVMQLLGGVFPFFEKLKHEGAEGQRKITQYTRYGTLIVGVFNSIGITVFLQNLYTSAGKAVVPNGGLMFTIAAVTTLLTGTMIIMWLGERITDRGIGNGISLIIFAGIVVRYPIGFYNMGRMIYAGSMPTSNVVIILATIVIVTGLVVYVTQAERKLPVQYAKRIVGRKIYGGQSSHIPLKVNTAGVIPIIFAQAVIMFPKTIAAFFKESVFMNAVSKAFSPGAYTYTIIYVLLIVFFAYFYTAIVLNPIEMANNMKKFGGFIPGKKPGRNTAEYLNSVIARITLPGAVFFAMIAVIPQYLINYTNSPIYFGGTSLIIVVGVALDILQQLEGQLISRHYDGFMKHGKIRGRRSR